MCWWLLQMCVGRVDLVAGSPVETVVRVPEWSLMGSLPGAVDGEQALLGPVVDLFTFELVDLGGVLFSRDTWGCDMALVCKGRLDTVTIGGVLDSPGSGRWEGEELRPGIWAAYGSGGVHMSTGRAGQVNAEIVVDRDALDDAITTLGREPSGVDGGVSVLTPREVIDVETVFLGAGFHGRRQEPQQARLAVLDAVAHIFSEPSRGEPRSTRRLSSRDIVMTAIEYARTCHARRPSVVELCRVSAVSERRLMYSFQEMTGVSPRRFFALAAMARVHTSLVRGSIGEVTVGDVAFDHGCYHLGRFAAAYRRTYGELPSETLRREP
jgi:AraC-like DNA-binding protein